MDNHAMFEIVEDKPQRLVLRDLGSWDKRKTITNDAEFVVEFCQRMLINGKRLFYYDSENELTELLIRDGKFKGFGPGEVK